jgi:ABC-type transporter MlaC component
LRVWLGRTAILILALAAFGAARAAPRPADPILTLHAGLVRVFAGPGAPSEPAIEALARNSFDMPAITLAVLGDAAKSATPAQRDRLGRVLLSRLARQIALAGRQGASAGFTVVGTQPAGGTDFVVTTRDQPPAASGGAHPGETAWRVRREGRRFRIVDRLRDGLSTVGVEHADFAAELQGRSLATVIAEMERRAAAPRP